MGFGIHFRACGLEGSMGIHFICIDIRGDQYKCFLALLFLQPLGLHEGWFFVQLFFLSLLLLFCTLKPLPSVILEEAGYCSVWGTTVCLSGLAAGPRRCPTPVTLLVTAALPELRGCGGTSPLLIGSKFVLLAGAQPLALCCQTDAT